SKSAALPLGYTPAGRKNRAARSRPVAKARDHKGGSCRRQWGALGAKTVRQINRSCDRASPLAASLNLAEDLMPGTLISGKRELALTQLSERVERAAAALASIGVKRGDAVALMLRNDFAFFEASGAAGSLGAYPVPVNWHFTVEEAGYIIRDSGAK